MEGNGHSIRIWLDLILRRSLKRCLDWSQISHIRTFLGGALTDKINDRERFMEGFDYSCYYEG